MASPLLGLVGRDGTTRTIPIIAPPALDSKTTHPPETILFLHPGYPPAVNVLFSLPCIDSVSDSEVYGVHHRTALTACQIVANNAFKGFLAFDAKGESRVDATIRLDGILTCRNYFFIVEDDVRYPVVPSFRDWEFPHDRIPDSWSRLPAAKGPGDACLITRYPWAVNKSHVIPSNESDWFGANGMSRYSSSRVPDIDASQNILPLRMDMHFCFDRLIYTFVPKPTAPRTSLDDGATDKTFSYTLHILAGDQPLFARLHHDIQLPHLQGVAAEYLFARFALTIFIGIKPFINAGSKRRVARFVVKDELAGPEIVYEEMDGRSLQSQYGGGKRRSASPSKRKRSGEGTMEEEEEDEGEGEACVLESDGGNEGWYGSVLELECERGRPRKRPKTAYGNPNSEESSLPIVSRSKPLRITGIKPQ